MDVQPLDYERLERLAIERGAEFRSAKPFPHIVIDDFLPGPIADALAEDFAFADEESWKHYHHYNERKLAITDLDRMPAFTARVIEALQSQATIDFVGRLSGIEGLISDPSLEGAGMHLVRRGGFLNVHTDFLTHTKQRNWRRHINLIIYLNKDWQEEWSGNLELWNDDLSECVQSITPLFNRCIIFNTLTKSYHGHPEKLACPPDRNRKSLLLYYYRDEGEELELASTNYRPLPGDSIPRKLLITADRILLRLYTFAKRHTKVSDRLMDRILRRF